MKLSNIPHVRAEAIDAALTNFFAANELKPAVLGKRRLRNLVHWLECQHRYIANVNEKGRLAGWANLLEHTSENQQSLFLQWTTQDDGVWIETRKWTDLASIRSLRLSSLGRSIASQAHSFKVRIYSNGGRCTYFLWTF